MKKRNTLIVFILLTLVFSGFTMCENDIIGKWWDDEQRAEIEYIPVTKVVPQIVYERIVEKVIETIYEQLPPEIIYEIVSQTVEVTIDRIVEVEKIVEVAREVIVEKEIYINPTPEEIKIYIKENPEIIIEVIREDNTLYEIIKEIVLKELSEEELKEIIKNLPPEIIYTYLTDLQIKYIILQQPPQVILQSIEIIDIQYIIFAGESRDFNGPPGSGAPAGTVGTTPLTPQEISFNLANVFTTASALAANPDYMVILHGNANPVTFTAEETAELKEISSARAVNTAIVLDEEFRGISGAAIFGQGDIITDTDGNNSISTKRLTTSGYGGDRNLSAGSNPNYVALNRRVEMILFRVITFSR